jgi:hypothetical protein
MGFLVPRDEREAGIDAAADRLSYIVLSFGVLVVVAYRSMVQHEAAWELLALVVLGGAVGTAVRARRRAVSTRLLAVLAGAAVVGFGAAALIVIVRG